MILGIDTDSYGFHSHSDGMRIQSLSLSKKIDVEERRISTYQHAKKFFMTELHGGIIDVFCEEPLALKNGRTTRVLCLQAGAIWSAHVEVCLEHGINSRWHWVDVASWKKRIVGNGNASKEQIALFCNDSPVFQSLIEFRGEGVYTDHVDNPNLYDAWCVLQYGRWFVSQL